MKISKSARVAQQAKRLYKKPTLMKHGKIVQITLKGGSAIDSDMTNTYQG